MAEDTTNTSTDAGAAPEENNPAGVSSTSADALAELEALAAALPPTNGQLSPAPVAQRAPEEPFVPSGPHTYPDGSVVYGCPPFPELSPLQLEAKRIREETPAQDTFARQQAAEEAARLNRANMVTGASIEQSTTSN